MSTELLNSRQDFINFFSAIPDNEWCTFELEDLYQRRCAVGHLMYNRLGGLNINDIRSTTFPVTVHEDLEVLSRILNIEKGSTPGAALADINNGEDVRYQQPTPKARILAALSDN